MKQVGLFSTVNEGSLTEKMFIDAYGNMGSGTTLQLLSWRYGETHWCIILPDSQLFGPAQQMRGRLI